MSKSVCVVMDRRFPELDVAVLRQIAADYRKKHKSNVEQAQICDELADEIESQTPAPKPAEPTGLGAVVEDALGTTWVRVHPDGGPAKWHLSGEYAREPWAVWSAIDAVRVLSEGIA